MWGFDVEPVRAVPGELFRLAREHDPMPDGLRLHSYRNHAQHYGDPYVLNAGIGLRLARTPYVVSGFSIILCRGLVGDLLRTPDPYFASH